MSMFKRPKAQPVLIATIAVLFGSFLVMALLKSSAAYAPIVNNLAMSSGGVIGEFKIWTLVTHPLVASIAWYNVVINCLILYMFAGELEEWWGGARLLLFFILVSLGAGLACLLVGFITPTATAGARPLVVASICAWGLIFRDRRSSLFGIVELKGIHYVWLSLGIVALDALSFGPLMIVPRLGGIAMAVVLTMGLWRKNFVKVTWGDFLAKVGLRKKPRLTVVPPLSKKPGKYDIN